MVTFYEPADYQAACVLTFETYKKRILKVIPQAHVEHIGASALPGAISKGDLDVFVGVAAHAHEFSVKQLLSLGFCIKQDTLRTPELCMLESSDGDNIALQVVAKGSEFEDFLQFKQVMLSAPELIQKYNQMKRDAAHLDMDAYREVKSRFIERILSLN